MANCVKCGNLLGENVTVCPICGANNTIVPEVATTSVEEAPVQSVVSQEILAQQVSQPPVDSVPQIPVAETSVVPPVTTPQEAIPITNTEVVKTTPVVQEQANNVNVEEKPKKDKKVLIMGIIMGLLVFIILVLVIILFTKDNKPIVDNKESNSNNVTKLNKDIDIQLGDFILNVPYDWNYITNSPDSLIIFNKSNDLEDLVILINKENKYLDNFLDIENRFNEVGFLNVSIEEISLKNFSDKCKHVTVRSSFRIYDVYYVAPYPGYTIIITVSSLNQEIKEKYSDQIRKILDSLKYKTDLIVINDMDEYLSNYNKFKYVIDLKNDSNSQIDDD